MTQTTHILKLQILRHPHEPSGFTARLTLENQFNGPIRTIEEHHLGLIRHVIDACRQLLKSPGTPDMASDALTSVGIELFDLWLAPDWEAVQQRLHPGKPVVLVISSDVPEFMHFPWEALCLPDGVIMGIDPRFGIQRRPPGIQTVNRCRAISPGPLRILFMVSAPQDFQSPDATWEKKQFASALPSRCDPALPRIDTWIMETATQAELAWTIHQFQPHVVHLAGPALIRGTMGFFAFEEPQGQADVRTAHEISQELFQNSGVGLVVISGREANRAPPVAATGLLCQGMVTTSDLPMALAWPESLSALESVSFLLELYTQLALSTPLDHALTKARLKIASMTATLGRPGWLLANLYARGEQPFLFNAGFMLSNTQKNGIMMEKNTTTTKNSSINIKE
ncbi:MAG: DUF2797 domain-containing protein [Magnetococcus sp. YQC-5]